MVSIRTILFGLLIIIIIIGGSFLFSNYTERQILISNCEKSVHSDIEDSCFLKVAIDYNDPSVCELIIDESSKEWCYEELSIVLNNSKLCNKIIDEDERLLCFAKITKKDSLCDNIEDGGTKNGCYLYLAKSLNDISLCLKTEDSFKDFCFIQTAMKIKNESVCMEFDGESKDFCIYGYAMENEEIALCEQIEIPLYKDLCFLNTIKDVADIDICKNIDELFVEECYTNLAEKSQDLSVCIYDLYDSDAIYNCQIKSIIKLINISLDSKNISLCNNIPFKYYFKDEKLICFAAVSNNVELCDAVEASKEYTFSSGLYRDDCYSFVASASENHSICNKISSFNKDKKDDCISEVALKLNDFLICDKIIDSHKRNMCVNNVWQILLKL